MKTPSSHPAYIWRKALLSYFFFILIKTELKKACLFTFDTLQQLVNMLLRNGKYFRNKTENISLPVKIELAKTQKDFFIVFIKLLKCTLNFEKKMSLIAWVFSKLFTPKDVVTSKHKRFHLWKPLSSRHAHIWRKAIWSWFFFI